MSIPVLDKIFVEKQEVTIGSNMLNIKTTFRNSTVMGMTQGTVASVKLVEVDTHTVTNTFKTENLNIAPEDLKRMPSRRLA